MIFSKKSLRKQLVKRFLMLITGFYYSSLSKCFLSLFYCVLTDKSVMEKIENSQSYQAVFFKGMIYAVWFIIAFYTVLFGYYGAWAASAAPFYAP